MLYRICVAHKIWMQGDISLKNNYNLLRNGKALPRINGNLISVIDND